MAKRKGEGATAPSGDHVGYGHPPKEHRFQTGRIANPWGRKGKPRSKPDFLEERQSIRVGGRSKWVTRDEALDHALYKEALNGNVSAVKQLESRRAARLARQAADASEESFSHDDEAALLRLIERRRGSGGTTEDERTGSPHQADGDEESGR